MRDRDPRSGDPVRTSLGAGPADEQHHECHGHGDRAAGIPRPGVERVIYASSSSIYGANSELPKHEALLPQPISPYAVRSSSGRASVAASGRSWPRGGGLRYFNVSGPRQDPLSQYAIPNFVTARLNRCAAESFSETESSPATSPMFGRSSRATCSRDAEGGRRKVFNVAAGQRTPLNELLVTLERLTGRHVQPRYEEPPPGDVPTYRRTSQPLSGSSASSRRSPSRGPVAHAGLVRRLNQRSRPCQPLVQPAPLARGRNVRLRDVPDHRRDRFGLHALNLGEWGGTPRLRHSPLRLRWRRGRRR
jgi:hypothetical protein